MADSQANALEHSLVEIYSYQWPHLGGKGGNEASAQHALVATHRVKP